MELALAFAENVILERHMSMQMTIECQEKISEVRKWLKFRYEVSLEYMTLEMRFRYSFAPNFCLEIFARLGSVNWVNHMITKGVTQFNRPAKIAFRYNHFEVGRLLISRGANDYDCYMNFAIGRGYLETVKFLIPFFKTIKSFSGKLEYAAKCGNLEIVKLFANINPTSISLPALLAAKNGHIEIVRFFLGLGFKDFNLLLVEGCKSGRSNIVELAIELGANEFAIPLCEALRGNYDEIAKLLLHKVEDQFDMCMEWGVIRSKIDVVKLMIEKGATEINRCVDLAHDVEILKLLVKNGAKITNQTLYNAIENRRTHLVRFILKNGATDYNYALKNLANSCDLELLKFVVSRGANNFNEALLVAAKWGNMKNVKYLISCGANNYDEAGQIASRMDYREIYMFLCLHVGREIQK